MIKQVSKLVLILGVILLQGCFKETFLPITAAFEYRYVSDRKAAPTAVRFQNNSEGADTYKWTFEGANITASTDRTPPEILFTKPGKYKIKLTVSNVDGQTSTKEEVIEIGDLLAANFEYTYEVNNLAPAKVTFKNTSVAGQRFEWIFENADKATATEANPQVTFLKEGDHKVTLRAYSGTSFTTKEMTVKVGPALAPNFELLVQDFNFNREAPLQLKAVSQTKGGITYQWSVNDATVNIAADKDSVASFTLPAAKTYTVRLTASNGKESKTVEKQVEVKPNTNLLSFENVKLGMNPNAEVANYYVTRRNLNLTAATLDTLRFGKEVDLVFFSRDSDFSYARFVSPDKASTALLPSIPQTKATTFINLLEACEACTKITNAQFAGIKTAKDFTDFTFKFSDAVVEGFTAALTPRYVPFKTYDGRIGIIKIKEFVKTPSNSYILTDIKVMRKP